MPGPPPRGATPAERSAAYRARRRATAAYVLSKKPPLGIRYRRAADRRSPAAGIAGASGLALMRATEHGWLPWSVTIVATAMFSLTEINPILLLALGAAALSLVDA